jgi:hypothetical protein
MKCSLEDRVNNLSKRISSLRKSLDNWKNNHKAYIRKYSKRVRKNQRKKMQAIMRIFVNYKRLVNNRQLNIVQRGKTRTPRHIFLLTRTERNKLMRLLNHDYRRQNGKDNRRDSKDNKRKDNGKTNRVQRKKSA